MSTHSTIPTVKAQMVTRYSAVLSVPVTYAWPGKETESECVFLGPHPATADIRLDASSQIPTIKADRKQRQEEYVVQGTVWSWRPDVTVQDAAICEARAFEMFESIEDVHADTPRIGLAPTVLQSTEITGSSSTLFPFQSGWACELSFNVTVKARLT